MRFMAWEKIENMCMGQEMKVKGLRNKIVLHTYVCDMFGGAQGSAYNERPLYRTCDSRVPETAQNSQLQL